MSDNNCILAGKVISYIENCGSTSSKVKALVQAGTTVVDVNLDFLQYQFVMQEYPVGSAVTLSFYGGSWHFQEPKEQADSGLSLTRALESVGRQTSYIKKSLTGPSRHDLWEQSIKVDVEGDLDFIKSHVGTFDMGDMSAHEMAFKGLRSSKRSGVRCT